MLLNNLKKKKKAKPKPKKTEKKGLSVAGKSSKFAQVVDTNTSTSAGSNVPPPAPKPNSQPPAPKPKPNSTSSPPPPVPQGAAVEETSQTDKDIEKLRTDIKVKIANINKKLLDLEMDNITGDLSDEEFEEKEARLKGLKEKMKKQLDDL